MGGINYKPSKMGGLLLLYSHYTGTAVQAPSYNLVETCQGAGHVCTSIEWSFQTPAQRLPTHINGSDGYDLKPAPSTNAAWAPSTCMAFAPNYARRTPKTILSNPSAEIDALVQLRNKYNQSISRHCFFLATESLEQFLKSSPSPSPGNGWGQSAPQWLGSTSWTGSGIWITRNEQPQNTKRYHELWSLWGSDCETTNF